MENEGKRYTQEQVERLRKGAAAMGKSTPITAILLSMAIMDALHHAGLLDPAEVADGLTRLQNVGGLPEPLFQFAEEAKLLCDPDLLAMYVPPHKPRGES